MKKIIAAFVFCLCVLPVAAAAGVVEWQKLAPFLPGELNGFKPAGAPEGQTVKLGGNDYSSVSFKYGTERRIDREIVIHSGTVATSTWNTTLTMGRVEIDTPRQMIKQVEIQGFKGFQSYRKDKKRATVWLALANDLLVIATIEDVPGPQPAIDAIGTMKLKDLAKLANTGGK